MSVQQEADLGTRIRLGHAGFLAAAASRDASTLRSEPAVGEWSVRDIAGHLADWATELLVVAQHGLGQGPAPAGHPILDGEAYNQEHAAMHQDESWDAARARLDDIMEQAAVLADSLTPEQLDTPVQMPWDDASTVRQALGAIAGHHAEHAGELA